MPTAPRATPTSGATDPTPDDIHTRFFNLRVPLNAPRPPRIGIIDVAFVLLLWAAALALAHTALGAAVDLRVAQDRQARMGAW